MNEKKAVLIANFIAAVSVAVAAGSLAVSVVSYRHSEQALRQQAEIVWIGSFTSEDSRWLLHLHPADQQTAVQMASFEFPSAFQSRYDLDTVDLHAGVIDLAPFRKRLVEMINTQSVVYVGNGDFRDGGLPLAVPVLISSRYTVSNRSYGDRSLYLLMYSTIMDLLPKESVATLSQLDFTGCIFVRRLRANETHQAALADFWTAKREGGTLISPSGAVQMRQGSSDPGDH